MQEGDGWYGLLKIWLSLAPVAGWLGLEWYHARRDRRREAERAAASPPG